MSLDRPTSELRMFSVPWTKGDNNLLKFNSVTDQTNAFIAYYDSLGTYDKYYKTHYDIIRDGVICIDANAYAINKYNYMMFKNPDISSTREYWYAYIDRIEWLSYNSCNVYYTLDAWQNYQFFINFKKCFIERSHVPVSVKQDDWEPDVAGNYLAPEPLSVTPQVERVISNFNEDDNNDSLSWSPQWVLHATSKKVGDDYKYSGTGSGGTLTSEYGFFVNSTSDIQALVKDYGRKSADEIASDVGQASGNQTWKDWINAIFAGTAGSDAINSLVATTSVADLQDHRNELIGLYAIPSWVKTHNTDASNDIVHKQVPVTLTTGTLAVSKVINNVETYYEPHNKKMLTSMCKGYSIFTPNGFKIALKPELFTSSIINIGLYGSEMATDGVMMHVGNYTNESSEWHKLHYSCQSRLGYDANTGLDKTLNQLSAMIGSIGTVANIAGSAYEGNVIGAVSGLGSAVSGARNMIDAIGQRGVNTGSSGNLISITGNRARPKMVDVSPNWAECEYIDDYLDVYGYAIDEIKSVNITSRPAWNYIKVSKLNATIKAPDEYAQVIMNAFQSGCHIWHTSIANVGNFGLTNR